MSDERLRELERAWKESRAKADFERYARECVRVGNDVPVIGSGWELDLIETGSDDYCGPNVSALIARVESELAGQCVHPHIFNGSQLVPRLLTLEELMRSVVEGYNSSARDSVVSVFGRSRSYWLTADCFQRAELVPGSDALCGLVYNHLSLAGSCARLRGDAREELGGTVAFMGSCPDFYVYSIEVKDRALRKEFFNDYDELSVQHFGESFPFMVDYFDLAVQGSIACAVVSPGRQNDVAFEHVRNIRFRFPAGTIIRKPAGDSQ